MRSLKAKALRAHPDKDLAQATEQFAGWMIELLDLQGLTFEGKTVNRAWLLATLGRPHPQAPDVVRAILPSAQDETLLMHKDLVDALLRRLRN